MRAAAAAGGGVRAWRSAAPPAPRGAAAAAVAAEALGAPLPWAASLRSDFREGPPLLPTHPRAAEALLPAR